MTSQPTPQPSRTAARWLAVLVPALIIYFAPLPGLTDAQRHLVAVFLGTVVALFAQPVPMGASLVIAMTVLAIARILPPAKVLSGFSNVTVWLIFSAFLFARAVTTTGLGLRIACALIAAFGRGPLSLAWCVAGASVVLAPFVPSDTARGGGVIYPITRGLTQAFGSEPDGRARGIGAFLMLAAFHTNYTASAMFLTGMVANPLIADFARAAGAELTWLRWAAGSCLPGAITLLLVPVLLLRLSPPGLLDMGPARTFARRELDCMGRMSRRERLLVAILVAVMAGWVTSPLHGLANTFVALAGVSAILLLDVLAWDDLLAEKKAWDVLIWFAPLLMMTDALAEMGVIRAASNALFGWFAGWGWPLTLAALVASYLYVHYLFASLTAQATVLYPAFLGAAVATGAPPMLAALPLAYFSSLDASLTHYSTGSAPVFFAPGYVSQWEWWRIGFVISMLNLAIWLGVGALWWKLIGLW